MIALLLFPYKSDLSRETSFVQALYLFIIRRIKLVYAHNDVMHVKMQFLPVIFQLIFLI